MVEMAFVDFAEHSSAFFFLPALVLGVFGMVKPDSFQRFYRTTLNPMGYTVPERSKLAIRIYSAVLILFYLVASFTAK